MSRYVIFSLLIVSLLSYSCGREHTNPWDPDTHPNIMETMEDGWAAFERADFDIAIQKFNWVVGVAPNYADAYNGLGWSYGGKREMGTSIEKFFISLEKGSITDVYAGLCLVYAAECDFDRLIQYGDETIDREGESYVFAHDVSVTADCIHLQMAQAYYHKQDYTNSYNEVQEISGYHTLDPGSPTFVEDLLLEIERLSHP